MKKNKKNLRAMTTILLTLPPPGLATLKIQCLCRGERGKEGAGAASCWGERRRKMEPGKKTKNKSSKVTQPPFKKIILQLLQNCIGPHQLRDSVYTVYAGFKEEKKL